MEVWNRTECRICYTQRKKLKYLGEKECHLPVVKLH